MAAEQLARGGASVYLFEERPGWEKPCGGGLTAKALRRYPFLLDSTVGAKRISEAELIAATGESVRFQLRRAVAVCSRKALNQQLVERAAQAGAEVIADRIVNLHRINSEWGLAGRERCYRAGYVILAAGARSRLRAQLAANLAAKDFMLTSGYYVSGDEELLRVRFLENFEGYLWAFPRADHLSVGICAKAGEGKMAELQAYLHEFMDRHGYSRRGARKYAHLLPGLTASSWSELRLAGDGWALAGDASGLVDPLTGEGIYFAMRSGELLGECWSAGDVAAYPQRVWEEFGSQLAHGVRLTGLYYRSNIFGRALSTRMIQLCHRGAMIRELLQDLFEGAQPYSQLLSRLYLDLGATLVEIGAQSLTGILRGLGDSEEQGTDGGGHIGTYASQ